MTGGGGHGGRGCGWKELEGLELELKSIAGKSMAAEREVVSAALLAALLCLEEGHACVLFKYA